MQKNRVVVITGAAGGIGSVLVTRFLANGDSVLATDANAAALKELRGPWGNPDRLHTCNADVASSTSVADLARNAQDRFGQVNVLINCAGFFPIQPFETMSTQEWRQVVDINLTGVFEVTRAVLPLMKSAGWGRIVNFGSASTFHGTPGQAHYVAAKAGVIGFSRTLAREVGAFGITVNVITPGLTVTKAVRASFPPEMLQLQLKRRAIQREQVPEDLVGPTLFLASPDSDFVTGQILNVDGGSFLH
jgi:NAD(P)-dependent dehydrogenase (short-subunit alcohol dehydrogenase family)